MRLVKVSGMFPPRGSRGSSENKTERGGEWERERSDTCAISHGCCLSPVQ